MRRSTSGRRINRCGALIRSPTVAKLLNAPAYNGQSHSYYMSFFALRGAHVDVSNTLSSTLMNRPYRVTVGRFMRPRENCLRDPPKGETGND